MNHPNSSGEYFHQGVIKFGSEVSSELTDPTSYANVHESLGKLLKDPDDEAFDLAAACVLANGREGDAAALFLVAPPSTGKTEIVNAMSDVPWAYEQTSMTPQTFASGMKVTAGGKNPSLLKRLTAKNQTCLLNKEFTTVMEMRQSDRDSVISTLREIMDGSLTKDFGTGDRVDWHGKLGLLAAVTPEIEKRWAIQTSLGARWVWVRLKIPESISDRTGIAYAAIEADETTKLLRAELKKRTTQLLVACKGLPDALISEDSKKYLANLAELTARGRTVVDKDRDGVPTGVKPSPEGPGRLAKAFHRLAGSLALVRGHTEVTAEDLRSLRRVAEDTVPVARAAIYRVLSKQPSTVRDLVEETGMSSSTIERTLSELELLDLCHSDSDSAGVVGRPRNVWTAVSRTQ
jgi:hypothetical protein